MFKVKEFEKDDIDSVIAFERELSFLYNTN